MIFNSFTVANDYNFGAQWQNDRRVFLPTNKLKAFVYLLRVKFFKWSCEFFLYSKPFRKKLLYLVLSLFMNMSAQLNKVTQDLIYICKQKTFSSVSSINSSQTDKALPVKTSKSDFVTF